ncbi:PP2C family protein-serine/threonine phosphatase [Nocardia caishijiensis]|uniref:Protein phosphatase n=1 Tax=Nocardia caishijiensis TaxID=184756 RepID=A0ABQ6YI01_9NOCA|nr:protein phosphatase 2C domain-containing protein [Nocardia caishijiensis]KAF0845283.1 protein phosphatase [Nocardia caishijiensis]
MSRVSVTAITHRGAIREDNEDCVGWSGWSLSGNETSSLSIESTIHEPMLIVVCDGMGGHAGGAQASRMACELLTAPGGVTGDSVAELTAALRARLQLTSDAINDRADAQPELAGMGCTVVGAAITPDGHAVVFNVGDSRCYRLEDRYLAQLSVDHRRMGGNTLLQALGGGLRVILEPDFFDCPLPTHPGLLLCTDGLDDYADQREIEQLLLADPTDVPARLRDLALRGGGGDNVTIVQVAAPGRPPTTQRVGDAPWPH